MRKIINHRQLAFLLGCSAQAAKEKIAYAYCKENGRVADQEYMDLYPATLDVEVLEKHTGLEIAWAIKDIEDNYLKRSATRRYILDLPAKFIDETREKPKRVNIPAGIRSLLPTKVQREIVKIWHERYGHKKSIAFPEV